MNAFLDFLLILNFDCEVYLITVSILFTFPLCILSPTLRFHLWVYEFILAPFYFAEIHFKLAFLLIHDNIQWSNVVVFQSNLNSIFSCFARPCIMWHWFTSSHHDFDSCTSHFFYFTSFFLIKMNLCCAYVMCVTISYLLAYFVSMLFPLPIFIAIPIQKNASHFPRLYCFPIFTAFLSICFVILGSF